MKNLIKKLALFFCTKPSKIKFNRRKKKMFEVGQLVTGNNRNCYGITSRDSLCMVKEVYTNSDTMLVTVVAHAAFSDCCSGDYRVSLNNFKLCTYAEFMERHPAAYLASDYTAEELSKINNGNTNKTKEEEKKTMELRMNKEKLGDYVLSNEEKAELREEIIKLLREYDYNPSEYGVNQILEEWIKNKGWMINLFKQHPNYNGKYQIAFDSDFNRKYDRNALVSFSQYVRRTADTVIEQKKIGAFSYEEVVTIARRLVNILKNMSDIKHGNRCHVLVNGKTYEEIEKEKDDWMKKYDAYQAASNRGEIEICGGKAYTKESYNLKQDIVHFFYYVVEDYTDHIANDVFAQEVNKRFPEVKAVAGQKTSRIINKICTLLGISKDPEYNREFAKYSDAINPLTIKKHTVLSCHPVDYFTMSFGNSWASCHTIDKKNKRGMENDYQGCYSSGTESYMLDPSSFVFYTVDKAYNGDKLELQPKINRNMFHMGEDKLIQARVYPQATDGETGMYRDIREIVQKTIADCLGAPNMWKNVKGTSECSRYINSEGTHYRDYESFSDCNVSYLKTDGSEEINSNFIVVGHNPICPCCGDYHDSEEAIECEDCYTDGYKCCECGEVIDYEGDIHYIDGDYYCEDCCFYCDYHECWEVGNRDDDAYYVDGYGRVCEDALEDEDAFYECAYCGEWHRVDEEHIIAEDGTHFCDIDCAEKNHYYTTTSDGKWYPEDEIRYCEYCEEYVHVDDWNDELECCVDCEDKVIAEREEEREVV